MSEATVLIVQENEELRRLAGQLDRENGELMSLVQSLKNLKTSAAGDASHNGGREVEDLAAQLQDAVAAAHEAHALLLAAQESEAAALQRAEQAEANAEHQVVRRVVEVAAMKAALNAKVNFHEEQMALQAAGRGVSWDGAAAGASPTRLASTRSQPSDFPESSLAYMNRQLEEMQAQMQQLQAEMQMGAQNLEAARSVPATLNLQDFTPTQQRLHRTNIIPEEEDQGEWESEEEEDEEANRIEGLARPSRSLSQASSQSSAYTRTRSHSPPRSRFATPASAPRFAAPTSRFAAPASAIPNAQGADLREVQQGSPLQPASWPLPLAPVRTQPAEPSMEERQQGSSSHSGTPAHDQAAAPSLPSTPVLGSPRVGPDLPPQGLSPLMTPSHPITERMDQLQRRLQALSGAVHQVDRAADASSEGPSSTSSLLSPSRQQQQQQQQQRQAPPSQLTRQIQAASHSPAHHPFETEGPHAANVPRASAARALQLDDASLSLTPLPRVPLGSATAVLDQQQDVPLEGEAAAELGPMPPELRKLQQEQEQQQQQQQQQQEAVHDAPGYPVRPSSPFAFASTLEPYPSRIPSPAAEIAARAGTMQAAVAAPAAAGPSPPAAAPSTASPLPSTSTTCQPTPPAISAPTPSTRTQQPQSQEQQQQRQQQQVLRCSPSKPPASAIPAAPTPTSTPAKAAAGPVTRGLSRATPATAAPAAPSTSPMVRAYRVWSPRALPATPANPSSQPTSRIPTSPSASPAPALRPPSSGAKPPVRGAWNPRDAGAAGAPTPLSATPAPALRAASSSAMPAVRGAWNPRDADAAGAPTPLSATPAPALHAASSSAMPAMRGAWNPRDAAAAAAAVQPTATPSATPLRATSPARAPPPSPPPTATALTKPTATASLKPPRRPSASQPAPPSAASTAATLLPNQPASTTPIASAAMAKPRPALHSTQVEAPSSTMPAPAGHVPNVPPEAMHPSQPTPVGTTSHPAPLDPTPSTAQPTPPCASSPDEPAGEELRTTHPAQPDPTPSTAQPSLPPAIHADEPAAEELPEPAPPTPSSSEPTFLGGRGGRAGRVGGRGAPTPARGARTHALAQHTPPSSPRARVQSSPRSSSDSRGSASALHLSTERNALLSSSASSSGVLHGNLRSASPLSRSVDTLAPHAWPAHQHHLPPSPLRRSQDSSSRPAHTRASALAAQYRLHQLRPTQLHGPLSRTSVDSLHQRTHPSSTSPRAPATSTIASSRHALRPTAATTTHVRPHTRAPVDPDLAPILRRSTDLPLARNSRGSGGASRPSSAACANPRASTSSSVSSLTTMPIPGLPRSSKPSSLASSGHLLSAQTHGPSLRDPLPASSSSTGAAAALRSQPPTHFPISRATSASASTTSLHTMDQPPQQHSAFSLHATGAGGSGGGAESSSRFLTSSWPPHASEEGEGAAAVGGGGSSILNEPSSSRVSPITLAASSARSRSVDCLNRPASLDLPVAGSRLRPSTYVGSTGRRATSQAIGHDFRSADQYPYLPGQQRSASYSGESHPYLFFGDQRASSSSGSMGWGAYPNWDTNREFGPLTREQRPRPAPRPPQQQGDQAPPTKLHLPSFLFLKSEARRLAQLEAQRAVEAAANAEAAAAEAKRRREAAAEEALQEVEHNAAAARSADDVGGGAEAGAEVQDEGVSDAQQQQGEGVEEDTQAGNEGQQEEGEGEQGHGGRTSAEGGKRRSRSIGRTLGQKLSTLFGGGGAPRNEGDDQ
ncbi:hypothetical protein DUNSADRAFT_2710 [Dunaliella salina]|uniref:Proteophosphoglycan ppg4 n=1 Tax=Dunaliella salina TaxID=3046 RepID=A0ABQ7H8B3_DUNSA|nr:hypothetical protein DUNSADRAFT_2710 [Dunaliella salina]|eukprot:KAF5843097.1 hypothetical protein DUNSADRAFT_2710 [Dunaliella salina]